MRKRLLCVLTAAALILGVLAGCGDIGANGDPAAVMNERVKAVNDAINYECVGIEETVEAGLLFYSLTIPLPSGPRDYGPDKPLDYRVWFKMVEEHMKGIASDDTYVPLLRDAWKSDHAIGEFSEKDVIKTGDLYIYYDSVVLRDDNDLPKGQCSGICFVLVKGTDIMYRFETEENWFKADYNEDGQYDRYTGDDAEYIFTAGFWKAFAQTVKFAGNADDDSNGELVNISVGTVNARGRVKVPYIEEWYAGETMSPDGIRSGFENFVKNGEVIVDLYFDDETVKTYPAIKKDDDITIDLGNGQVWVYCGDESSDWNSDGYVELKDAPSSVTGENLPESGYFYYNYDSLVIDDFGQGEPTMFFNNALYKYAGGGEVTLIHDFSEDIDGYWRAMTTDADRNYLLISQWAEPLYSENFMIIDLKTFEVTDSVSIIYDVDEDGIFGFGEAAVNGVSVDEETAADACSKWYSVCDVELFDKMYDNNVDLDAAWYKYICRE